MAGHRHQMRALGAVVAGVIVVGAVPASSSPGARLATPELIEQAVAAGTVDRVEADAHLWRAFTDPTALPARYRSTVPWRGTMVLLELQERLAAMPPGEDRIRLETISGALGTSSCGAVAGSVLPQPGVLLTDHFRIEYTPGSTNAAGLTIEQYADALEESWSTSIDDFGWPAPPTPTNRYLVRVDPTMAPGLYGFVASMQNVGDNPNSPWHDVDAHTSCMAINGNFSLFYPSPPLASMRSTAAHEFFHSLQFGIGALHGNNRPDSNWVEGGASWVEDEVFDTADDNHYWLWPNFTQSMGAYSGTSYYYWVIWRGITERFGSGTGTGGQTIMRDFFEITSRGTGSNITAMEQAVAARGLTLGEAFHDVAIAVWHLRACEGGYVLPYCYEEADGYVGRSGHPNRPATSLGEGEASTVSVRTDYAMGWGALPIGGAYTIGVSTQDVAAFRVSAVCDTGTGLVVTSFGAPVTDATGATLGSYDTSGCASATLVVTNEHVTAPNPSSSSFRTLDVSVTAA